MVNSEVSSPVLYHTSESFFILRQTDQITFSWALKQNKIDNMLSIHLFISNYFQITEVCGILMVAFSFFVKYYFLLTDCIIFQFLYVVLANYLQQSLLDSCAGSAWLFDTFNLITLNFSKFTVSNKIAETNNVSIYKYGPQSSLIRFIYKLARSTGSGASFND